MEYICPFCKTSIEDGLDSLIEHRKPGGECDTKMEERMTSGG